MACRRGKLTTIYSVGEGRTIVFATDGCRTCLSAFTLLIGTAAGNKAILAPEREETHSLDAKGSFQEASGRSREQASLPRRTPGFPGPSSPPELRKSRGLPLSPGPPPLARSASAESRKLKGPLASPGRRSPADVRKTPGSPAFLGPRWREKGHPGKREAHLAAGSSPEELGLASPLRSETKSPQVGRKPEARQPKPPALMICDPETPDDEREEQELVLKPSDRLIVAAYEPPWQLKDVLPSRSFAGLSKQRPDSLSSRNLTAPLEALLKLGAEPGKKGAEPGKKGKAPPGPKDASADGAEYGKKGKAPPGHKDASADGAEYGKKGKAPPEQNDASADDKGQSSNPSSGSDAGPTKADKPVVPRRREGPKVGQGQTTIFLAMTAWEEVEKSVDRWEPGRLRDSLLKMVQTAREAKVRFEAIMLEESESPTDGTASPVHSMGLHLPQILNRGKKHFEALGHSIKSFCKKVDASMLLLGSSHSIHTIDLHKGFAQNLVEYCNEHCTCTVRSFWDEQLESSDDSPKSTKSSLSHDSSSESSKAQGGIANTLKGSLVEGFVNYFTDD